MKKKILIVLLFITCCFSLFLIPSKQASAFEFTSNFFTLSDLAYNPDDSVSFNKGDSLYLDCYGFDSIIEDYGEDCFNILYGSDGDLFLYFNSGEFILESYSNGYLSLSFGHSISSTVTYAAKITFLTGCTVSFDSYYFGYFADLIYIQDTNFDEFADYYANLYNDISTYITIPNEFPTPTYLKDNISSYNSSTLLDLKESLLSYFINYYRDTSYDEGHDVGYNEGFDIGKTEGYDKGYDEGYDVAVNDTTNYIFDVYGEHLLGPFKDCTIRMYDYNNDVISTETYLFSDLAPLIYDKGHFDFSELFSLLVNDNVAFAGSISNPHSYFAFEFVFNETHFISEFDFPLFGFSSYDIYFKNLKEDEEPLFVTSLITDTTGPYLLSNDFATVWDSHEIISLTLISNDYWTFDGDDSFGFEDRDFSISIGSSTYYYLGYEDGVRDTTAIHYNIGYNDGFDNGKNEGYDLGYSAGYLDNNFSFQNLFWTIAGLPFESFKSIWNFEFLGVNLANFVTGLLLAGVAIFIIKKVI